MNPRSGFLGSPVRRLRRWRRALVFRRALARWRESPEAAVPAGGLLDELIRGWGNEDWAAGRDYLTAVLQEAAAAPGPILECGSGLSTVLLGTVAARRGLEVWSLEHHPRWGKRVRRALRRAGLDGVRLCQDPLRGYGDFDWYDPPLSDMPAAFSLVVCDGPPGHTRGGRYGLVPVMRARLGPKCVILLDDVRREAEKDILTRWARELPATVAIRGVERPFAVLTLVP